MKRYLEAGKIVAVQGIKGEVRIYPMCDAPEFLCGLRALYLKADGGGRLDIAMIRPHKNMVVAKIDGCDLPEQARKYIEKTVYLDRNDIELEEGRYFVDDLLGLEVVDANTLKSYGTVCDVSSNTAQDVYHVKTPDGEVRMIPGVKEFVKAVELETGRLLVTPIKGMFSDED